MKRISVLAVLLFVGVLAGCASKPYVETDYQVGYDFSQLKTFNVAESRQDVKENLIISPFTLGHVQATLASELAKRYQASQEGAAADFIVNFHVVVEEKIDPRSYNELYGYGWYGRGYYGYPRPFFYGMNSGVRVYEQGSLIVDIIDGKTNKPLWRGVSQKRLSRGLAPERQREILSGAVTEVIAQFPPVK